MRTSSRLVSLAALALTGCTLLAQGRSQQINFTSEPPGAVFTVAGQTGTTPATLDVPKDDYTILFEKPGYNKREFELKRKVSAYFFGSVALGIISSIVDVASGAWKEFESTDVHVVLEPLPDTTVELFCLATSDPPGAEIVVDGAVYGRATQELHLSWRPLEQEKQVRLKLAGYREKTLALGRGQARIHGVLDPQAVTVSVRFTSDPPGAEVRVDGRPVGVTPVTADIEWLPKAAPKKVEIAKDRYRPEGRELAAGSAALDVTLTEVVEETKLAVKVHPAGALIEVDGVSAGGAPAEVALKWSVSRARHLLKISHPGYVTKTMDLDREGAAAALEVRLAPSLPKVP